MAVEIHITKQIKLTKPSLIEGFPGMRLVGTISGSYLIDKLKMEMIGYLTSENFPPLAAIHAHKPLYPARIYASKKYNLLVLISEFIVPIKAVYELSDAIYDFAKKKKVKQIISLGAIVQKGDETKVFAVASDAKILASLEKHKKVEMVKEGVTTGVTGVLLARGAIENFPVVSFLAQANENYMDPHASAVVLEVLKDYLNLTSLDTGALEQEAKAVESKMKDMLSKTKETQEHYQKTATDSASTFGGMYG